MNCRQRPRLRRRTLDPSRACGPYLTEFSHAATTALRLDWLTIVEVLDTLGQISAETRVRSDGVRLTWAVLGGKNSKENTGFPDRWASASLSLICMLRLSGYFKSCIRLIQVSSKKTSSQEQWDSRISIVLKLKQTDNTDNSQQKMVSQVLVRCEEQTSSLHNPISAPFVCLPLLPVCRNPLLHERERYTLLYIPAIRCSAHGPNDPPIAATCTTVFG